MAAHADLSRLQQEADAHVLSTRPPNSQRSQEEKRQAQQQVEGKEEESVRVLPAIVPREERSSGEVCM